MDERHYMENVETCMFCAFIYKSYKKAQKHACFHVNFPFFYPSPPISQDQHKHHLEGATPSLLSMF